MLQLIMALLAVLIPLSAHSQSPQQIMERVMERDRERKAEVENYLLDQTLFGQRVLQYYERVPEAEANPGSAPEFRLVPASEIRARQNGADAVSAEEMALLGELPEQAVTNPWDYTERMAAVMASAELLGSENIDGRAAFHVRAEGLDFSQPGMEGQEFAIDTMNLWIDQEDYVPLKLRMDGSATLQGASQDVFFEVLMQEYQSAGPLFEPMRQVMRMGGVLTPEQEAEMEQAREQLQEMEAQWAEMPASQRQMMENMIGPQMAMLRELINGGGLQFETVTNAITVNAGLPDETAMQSGLVPMLQSAATGGGAGATGGDSAERERGPSREQQQACLQARIDEAREQQPRRRGIGGFLGGVGRAVQQLGDLDVGSLINSGASDAEISEQAQAAGVSEEAIAACLSGGR